MSFDLTDLRLFVHIVDAGSITAGARASHLSLAAASARVLRMETALATPLLTRGRRGVQPTAAGHALAQHARPVLQQAERLRLDLQDQARGAKGHITLLGTSAAVREYLPDTLGDFLARHPQVNVSVAEAVGEDAVQAVLDGSADIALVTERTSAQGLQTFFFVVNGFALVLPRGHPLVQEARGAAVSIVRAEDCDIVGLPKGSALQDTWEARAAARGARLNYRVRVPSFDAQVRLIERGVGVAMLPEAKAQRLARHRAVEVLRLSDPYLNRRLLICVRQLAALPAYTQSLVECLRAAHPAAAVPGQQAGGA
jgi:DNA-binding transcriptional LysR family regulator